MRNCTVFEGLTVTCSVAAEHISREQLEQCTMVHGARCTLQRQTLTKKK